MPRRFFSNSERYDDDYTKTKQSRLVTMHQAYISYDNSFKRRKNYIRHHCVCCRLGMTANTRGNIDVKLNAYSKLLCNNCYHAYRKYKNNKRLLKEENKILECIIHAL